MKGCRALTADEVARVSQAFRGTYAEHDRALFILGSRRAFGSPSYCRCKWVMSGNMGASWIIWRSNAGI
jgi:hypothetical protein